VSQNPELLSLAESVADGAPVNWETLRTHATDEARPVIDELRVLADLIGLHRSLPLEAVGAPTVLESTTEMPLIGTWGHLALLERLGGGSFGEVYRAWDPQLEREVALKLRRGEPAAEDPAASRIAAEGKMLARVRHPNVITVYGAAVNGGRAGIWMERVRGATLEQLLQERGPFSAREATLIGADLCRALAALHTAGLIHRDVKAQNVMREDGGRIVLMDLGIARHSGAPGAQASADRAGTPLYIAPEIFDGAPASPHTDLYSLGVLLYRLVTASFPVRAATIEGLRAAHAGAARVRLRDVRADLPSAFVRVVDRATASDPATRYATAGDLEADLIRGLEEPVVGAQVGAASEPGQVRQAFGWRAALAAVVVVAVGLSALSWRGLTGLPASPPAAPIRSIAVLPLANLSGDPAQQYLADGITDELISTLGAVGGLDVISRTSIMRFKESTAALPEIARALGVGAVLEGTLLVVPAPDERANAARVEGPAEAARATRPARVRVSARLLRAGNEAQIWNRTFEHDLTDVLRLQSEIAAAVAEGIGVELLRAPAPAAGGAQRPDAFDLYLRGRYQWNFRSREGFMRGIQYFREAIDRDPTFARPHAGLADSYNLLGIYGMIPRAEADRQASQAAARALELDPSLAEAHASLGHIRNQRLDWTGAQASFTRALELRPGYATAHLWYSTLLAQLGRPDEALAEIDRAVALDPLSAAVSAQRGAILLVARRYDEAIAQLERTLKLDPDFARARIVLAEAYVQKGDHTRALAEAERAGQAGGAGVELTADIGYIHAVAGRRNQAVQIARQLAAQYESRQDGAATGAAVVYAGLRDVERTIEWLDRAWERREAAIADLNVDQRFDAVRSDARFASLLKRLGLAQ
jgi:TolB-like protein/Tfp pilus assembly protein PilF